MARKPKQAVESGRPFFEEIEPRLLLSAGLEAFVLQDDPLDNSNFLQSSTEAELVPQTTDAVSDASVSAPTRELVFVDTDTPEYQQLLNDLLGSSEDGRDFEVILLDNQQSGIDQISETLANRGDLDAIHIISHGADGTVDLGNTRLDFESLLSNSKEISNWGQALTDDGDLLLYGCDLAASSEGQSLVNALARLTGADVAASNDLTGSAEQGGDWDLEYKVGQIETVVAFSSQLKQQWNNVLAPPTADAGGPYAINEGDAVLLDASLSSDPDGDPLTYAWDIDNDGQYDDAIGVSPTLTWAELQSFGIDDGGTTAVSYTIGVAVNDGNTTRTAASTIDVTNTAPTLTTTGLDTAGDGQVYTLNLNAYDPGNDTLSWTINWGDGTIDENIGDPSTATHTYNNAGLTYNITASATDEDGTYFQNQLLVSSSKTDSLMRYDTDGSWIEEFGAGAGLNYPVASTIGQDGNLYVTNWNGAAAKVAQFDPTTGAYLGDFVTSTDNGGMGRAAGLAFGPDGNLYVASTDTDEVLRFDGTTGAYLDVFVSSGTVNGPEGLVFGPDGNLYVGGYNDDFIYKFDGTTGNLLLTFDTQSAGGDNNLSAPEDITFGPDGNLYVASDGNSNVLRYDPTTGNFIDEFVTNGDGGLQFAQGLRFGPDGNLYVGSFGTNSILRYDGTTGAFIDAYVTNGSGGLDETTYFDFIPGHQVTVTSIDAQNDSYSVDEDGVLVVNALTDNATTTDLLAAWQFDEGSGTTTADATGNGNDGTLVNATFTTSSKTGDSALSLDGSGDYVQTTA
ncbi:MAG: DUF4347 domain-containing protein, partial [Thiohalophilus sp.]